MVSIWKVNHRILLKGLDAPKKKKKSEGQMTLSLKWRNSHPGLKYAQ